jgi:cell division protein FtsL
MANQGSAYNFELFEPKSHPRSAPPKRPNVIHLPKEKLEENRRPKAKAVKLVSFLLVFAVVSGIAVTFVNGEVQLTELSGQIESAEKALHEQQNVNSQLQIKLDSKFSMGTVENYASKNLGMKKTNRSQVTAVEVSKGDKSQVVAKTAVESWLERAWNAIKGFLS